MYIEKPLRFFLDKLCSKSPEPGGGSASALTGATAASLSGMLAALTIDKKGYDFCCECDDFPCDHLHPYSDRANEVPHNTKVFNLCLIKKMGLEKWAEEKAGEVKSTYFKGKFKL